MFREALAQLPNENPDTDPFKVGATIGLGRSLVQLGKTDEALPLLQSALETSTRKFGADNYRTAEAHLGLGECLRAMGRGGEARSSLLAARGILEPQRRKQPMLVAEVERELAGASRRSRARANCAGPPPISRTLPVASPSSPAPRAGWVAPPRRGCTSVGHRWRSTFAIERARRRSARSLGERALPVPATRRPRRSRGDRQPDAGAIRPRRHHRQQRRARAPDAVPRPLRRGMATRARGEPDRTVPDDQGGIARDEGAAVRPDREHLVHGRTQVSTLGGAHYTASKTGLLGLTRAAAKELGKFGITVNAVCPGMIDTELTRENATPELLDRLAAGYPVPRLGTALEVADLICFAASEAAGYITGASLDINGGDLMM